jgi:hypothetical protein
MFLNKFIIFVPFTQLYAILYVKLKSINRCCHKGHIIQEILATQRNIGITVTYNSKTSNLKEKIQDRLNEEMQNT